MDHTALFLIAMSLLCMSLVIENHGLHRHGRNTHPTLTMGLDVVSIMMWTAGLVAWLT